MEMAEVAIIRSRGNDSSRKDATGLLTDESATQPDSGQCAGCGNETLSSQLIRLDDYESPQLNLLFFYLLEHYPDLTPQSILCKPCLEESEKELQSRQIARVRGEAYFIDLVLGPSPILPTPERMSADLHYTGHGVTMAFVDSGFAPHPDLILPVNRVVAVYDAVNGKELRDFERDFSEGPPIQAWHGTMAATVAAGSGHLSGGYYRGIAPDARLVLVKAMTPERRIRTPQVRRALEWIRDNHERYGIRVVNLSLGVDETTRLMTHPVIALVEELVRRGVVVVAASGNNPSRPLVPPASAPSAITVGGYDDQNSLDWRRRELWHSSYGETPNGAKKPDLLGPSIWVAAPILLRTAVKAEAEALFYMAGADDDALMRSIPVLARETGVTEQLLAARTPLRARSILLERIRYEKQINANYKHVDGTSFAAPIVASIVAQMLEADSTLTPAKIREHLTTTAERIRGVDAAIQGYGVVRADKAIERVKKMGR